MIHAVSCTPIVITGVFTLGRSSLSRPRDTNNISFRMYHWLRRHKNRVDIIAPSQKRLPIVSSLLFSRTFYFILVPRSKIDSRVVQSWSCVTYAKRGGLEGSLTAGRLSLDRLLSTWRRAIILLIIDFYLNFKFYCSLAPAMVEGVTLSKNMNFM